MRLSLSLNTKVTLLTVILMPLLLMLGNWQLNRATEKRAIETEFISRQQQKPVEIARLDETADLAFRPVRLTGRFDNEHPFLLDNRVHAGQLGYEVLMPLRTDSGQWVLVNRGWIKGKADRRNLPEVPAVQGEVQTRGTIYVPPGKPFLLAEQQFEDVDWPLVVQAVEVDKFSRVLNRPLFPSVVRLDQSAPGALKINWQPINVQPEKHVAYAVQWFAMAAALAIWFVFANTNLWQLLKSARRP